MENKEAQEETQGQDNHKSRKASAPGFAAPDPSTGPEEILSIPLIEHIGEPEVFWYDCKGEFPPKK